MKIFSLPVGLLARLTFTIISISFISGCGGGGSNDIGSRVSSLPLAVNLNPVVLERNVAPIANPLFVTLKQNTAISIILTGTDPDTPGLGYKITAQPEHGRLDGKAPNITYTPDRNYSGPDKFSFLVADSLNTSFPAVVTLNIESGAKLPPVEEPPKGGSGGNVAPIADAALVFVVKNTPKAITLTGTDPDSPGLGFRVTSKPLHGRLDGKPPNLTYTPDTNYSGSDTFAFLVADSLNTSAPAIITLSVAGGVTSPPAPKPTQPTTPPPTTGGGGNVAPIADAATISIARNTPKAITLTGTDPDSPGLGFLITSKPTHGRLDGKAPNITYTPDSNYSGSDSFAFLVADSLHRSAPATISLVVEGAPNTAPVAKSSSSSTKANTAVSIALNATDADGDSLTYEITQAPKQGSLGTVSGNNVTYTPKSSFTGTDSFTFRASDGKNFSASATVTISVSTGNQAPVATSSSVSTAENSSVSIALNATDPDGDKLSYDIIGFPLNGSLGSVSGNSVIYTPNTGFSGNDTFTFRVFDGEKYSSTASISIVVKAVISNNQAPVAQAASVTTSVDTPFTLTLNGSDPDGDALTYSIVSSPVNGTVGSVSGNQVTYTPKSSYTGNDSFTFRVSDGVLNSSSAKVTITVASSADINLSTARQLSKTGLAGDKQAVVVTSTHAYVAGGLDGLLVYSNINTTPKKIHTLNTGKYTTAMRVSSDQQTLFISDEFQGLKIVDISNPAKAKIIGSVANFWISENVTISSDEKTAYISDYNFILVADISNHASPKLIGSIEMVAGEALSIAVSKDKKTLYAATGSAGLTVYDVSNPALPRLVSQLDTKENTARDVKLSADGKIAYVADGEGGVALVNISQPSNPFLISTWNDVAPIHDRHKLNSSALKLLSDGVTLLVAAGSGGIYSVDVASPTRPVTTGTVDTESFAFRFDTSADNSFLFALDFYFGLYIYDIRKR